MVQKTKRNRKSQSRSSRSWRQHIIRKMDEHEPITEQHHFYSKMVYDGNTMLTESQKYNEPIQRRKYTLKQLEREIPIGAELIKTHLDHKVPLALNKQTNPKRNKVYIRPSKSTRFRSYSSTNVYKTTQSQSQTQSQ